MKRPTRPAMPPTRHALRAHPASPAQGVRALHAALAPAAGGWQLHYELEAALDALRLPAPVAAPGPADGLWRHTCFEAFVGSDASARYHEFNFSPSGHWAAYAFDAPRQRAGADFLRPAPRLHWARTGTALVLDAWLPLAALPPDCAASSPVGLCAVIEAGDGALGYWALAHPAAQPDFHLRAGWTARLAP